MKILYILTALGAFALLSEIFKLKKLLLPVLVFGLLTAIASAIYDWNTNVAYFNNMVWFDNMALLFSALLCSIVLLWLIGFQSFVAEDGFLTDKSALVIFALTGAVILSSYSHMVMFFIGVEILSIPMYVLAGSYKDRLSSNEASMKYFLMGAFASAILLFGIALLYGATGSFHLGTIGTYLNSPEPMFTWTGEGARPLLYAGIIMLLCGMAFKVSLVPFHFWAPDVYSGAPTPVTAFMATVVKTAAFAAFLRLFLSCFTSYGMVWADVIWILAAATILIGNITAVYQTNIKRLLAYSSVAHAGYMALALLSMGENATGAVFYYAAAYSFASLIAFAVLTFAEDKEKMVTFESLRGLASRNKLLAFGMSIAMLSLAGIPPLAGFFGKYFLFASALDAGYLWIVLIAVLGSLIGVYYYLKVIMSVYTKAESGTSSEAIHLNALQRITLVICVVLTLILGLFPEFLVQFI